MAASSWGPPLSSEGDGPPGGAYSSRIDGSYTAATLPSFMDTEQNHGDLHLLRISGLDRPLPNVPFIIRKSVEHYVGGRIEGAFPEANRATYALKVRSVRQFKRLLSMTQLIDGTSVQITEHPTLNSTRCVVSCRDVIDVTETVLLEELKEQGVKEVRRITRRIGNERENTPSIILTCRGTNRPDHIDFGYIRCRTRPFYPSPMQCFNCWCFGHTKLRCKSNAATCGKCSENHPIPEDKACSNGNFCKQCQTNEHALSSRSCPFYKMENTIQRVKIDQGLSYPAARRVVEGDNGGRSYANAVESDNNDAITELSGRIDQLTAVVDSKDKEITELRNALAARDAPPPVERSEIESLQAIIASQSKQIEALTNQLSTFLKMVMPAGSIVTSDIVVPATNSSPVLEDPLALIVNEFPSPSIPKSDENSEYDSTSPDHSPNSTPRPTRASTTKPANKFARPGTPVPVAIKSASSPTRTPNKRSLTRIELTNLQQQKRVKHKNVSEGTGTTSKR